MSERRKVSQMILFIDGAIAAFDEAGEQIPELQDMSAIELWGLYAEAAGFDVDGCKFKTARDEVHGTIETCFDGPVERIDDYEGEL